MTRPYTRPYTHHESRQVSVMEMPNGEILEIRVRHTPLDRRYGRRLNWTVPLSLALATSKAVSNIAAGTGIWTTEATKPAQTDNTPQHK
jgi:hypothetical protein